MHMADALISPAVGATMWAATGGLIAYCSKKVRTLDDRKIPLMGVLGAFVFAVQMINFSIPGTGSSGHLGGGLLLAILLGPHAAFLTIASILVVQALFFADGGILAWGCNVFNLGFFSWLSYSLVYKKIITPDSGTLRRCTGVILAAVAALECAAMGVVFETQLSGITDLPFAAFCFFMAPVHLAIGIAEGAATAGILYFLLRARPDLLEFAPESSRQPRYSYARVIGAFLIATIALAGVVSWFASEKPDGLEWSLERAAGGREAQVARDSLNAAFLRFQEKISLLPDYALKRPHGAETALPAKAETSAAGLIGGLLTLVLALATGALLKKYHGGRHTPRDREA